MLEIQQLSFSYRKHWVFKDFSFALPDGQICLVTGINGVGKSTLLRLMAGVLTANSGTIRYVETMGKNPKRKIGFISDSLSFYESLTVSQACDYHRSAFGLPRIFDDLIRHTKVRGDQKIKELSAGQRTILHLSLVLSQDPELLLIDEVIHSIDAYLRRLFLDALIERMSQKTMTVVMVNLNFHDVEHLIDRVVLLKSGQVVVDETIDDLKAKVKKAIALSPPPTWPILFQRRYRDYSEFYIYPYSPGLPSEGQAKIMDLNLTEIVTAFIGGEYAEERIS